MKVGDGMTQAEKVLDFAKENMGIVTTRQVDELGVGRWVLQSLVNQGLLFKEQRGVYVTENGYAEDFFLLQQRYPKVIYSHETALFLHGFSLRVPLMINMTFLQGTSTTRMKADDIQPVMMSDKEFFETGIVTVERSDGTTIRVYDLERALVEILRPGYMADTQQVLQGYQMYAQSRWNLSKLFKYAKKFGVEEKVRDYMSVLLPA